MLQRRRDFQGINCCPESSSTSFAFNVVFSPLLKVVQSSESQPFAFFISFEQQETEANWAGRWWALSSRRQKSSEQAGDVAGGGAWTVAWWQDTVCGDTQNLNETESNFFSDTNFFDTESDTFLRYQIFTIPNPILFSVPNFFDTESETIKKMEKFRNREVSKPKRHTLTGQQHCEGTSFCKMG